MMKSLLGSLLLFGFLGSSSMVKAEPSSIEALPEDDISQSALDLIFAENVGETNYPLPTLEGSNLMVQGGDTASSQGSSSRENYGYVSLGLGVGIPNNASADNVSIRVAGRTANGSVDQNLGVGFAGELAAGYQYKDARFELAVGYGDLGGSGGNISTTVQGRPVSFDYDNDVSGSYVSVLVNGYYDIPTGTKWRPYVGAGLGYVNVSVGDIFFDTGLGRVEVVTSRNSAGTFGYQGKLGLSYEATTKGNVFGEVAYLGTASYKDYSALGVWRFALGWRQGF